MRIRDWSSDVCSSDLVEPSELVVRPEIAPGRPLGPVLPPHRHVGPLSCQRAGRSPSFDRLRMRPSHRVLCKVLMLEPFASSEERRVGKEVVIPFSFRLSPSNYKKNNILLSSVL